MAAGLGARGPQRSGLLLGLHYGGTGVGVALSALLVPLVLFSGVLFGAVFLSVAASTTALLQHNLPHTAWGAGISAFTTVFAAGQIVRPTVVGWVADSAGGLERGLVFSASSLWIGAALARRQRALGNH
jgi:hypothetical protein